MRKTLSTGETNKLEQAASTLREFTTAYAMAIWMQDNEELPKGVSPFEYAVQFVGMTNTEDLVEKILA